MSRTSRAETRSRQTQGEQFWRRSITFGDYCGLSESTRGSGKGCIASSQQHGGIQPSGHTVATWSAGGHCATLHMAGAGSRIVAGPGRTRHEKAAANSASISISRWHSEAAGPSGHEGPFHLRHRHGHVRFSVWPHARARCGCGRTVGALATYPWAAHGGPPSDLRLRGKLHSQPPSFFVFLILGSTLCTSYI